MEEKDFMWKEIQEKTELIEKKKALVAEKMSFLKKEMSKLECEKRKLFTPAIKNGAIEISVKDFEKALDKLEPGKEHKVSIKYNQVGMKEPELFESPESLRRAKSLKGGDFSGTGEIRLRINGRSQYFLKRLYLPASCEQKENPTAQDLILCFAPDSVSTTKGLIDIFAQAEKDRTETKSTKLSDGKKK